MEDSSRSVSMDINSLSFRCFVKVTPSPEGLDLVFRPSFDASDDESLIEIDLGLSPSKGIRVISIPKEVEFSFPPLGSATPVAHDDELSVEPCAWPYYFAPLEKKSHSAYEPDNIKSLLSSTRNRKPGERIITACLKFLKPTFGCFGGRKPSSKGKINEAQDPTARNIRIHPEKSSSIINLAELFLKEERIKDKEKSQRIGISDNGSAFFPVVHLAFAED